MKKTLLLLLLPLGVLGQVNHPVTNGDFETSTGGVPDSWTAGLGTLTVGDAYAGANGALLTSSSGSPNNNIINDETYSLTVGLPTYLTAWVKPTANNDRSALRLMQSDGTTNLIGGQAVVWNNAEYIDTWNKIMMIQYTPASDIDVKVRLDNPIANDIINYDDVQLVQNPLTVNGDMEIQFLSNSATTPYTQVYQKNQINPISKVTTNFRSGRHALMCNTVGATATFNQGPAYRHVREEAAMDYKGSIWVQLDAASPAADFFAELWVDNAKVATGAITTIDYATESGWVEIESPTYTSDDTGGGSVYLRLVCNNSGTDRAVFYVDDYILNKAPANSLITASNDFIKNNFTVSKTGVSLKSLSGNVQVFDLLGRRLASKQVRAQETLDFNFEEGTFYIVKVSAKEGTASRKVGFN
ncbi:T9SS type A sorting domain-containing protein [Pseudotamlana carrageenivorans]|uniref:Secretion system C-terminal sorting domain-containing protein n=1 Tax=Pseudotamlana carrageenivorans TaxID=2069432 RepID=A0A2I7SKW0_9FLAO|nr:T9SS type A sorting domain-containing protein [Tamlana carrageenivorans]AUS06543.1 hypothetical protein C1A40_14340 [Tamlana carrageenivorans]